MRVNRVNKKHNSKGFTLVELVIGIVLFSVAMVTVVTVLMPQAKRGIDPLWQVRGVSLAQSLLTEISSKAFDEASITSGGLAPCNDGTTPCSNSGQMGPDQISVGVGESRENFDDIDDYHGLILSGVAIANASGTALTNDMIELFTGFEARITVFYDDDTNGTNDDDIDNDGALDSGGSFIGNKKLISITVITPGGEQIPFATYRKNV